MPRDSAKVRAARLAQLLPLHWLRPLEAKFLQSRAKGSPSLIFLLAVPRGGSTLTYQSIIHSFQPVYLSNLWNLLYRVPYFGGALSQRGCEFHKSNFQSTHGFVEGACGPAEGLAFWSYWTGSELSDTSADCNTESNILDRIDYLRDVTLSLATPAKPMVAGYLGHSLAANKLREWFPEAIFIRLHREPLSNAMSIFEIRKERKSSWFSVLPMECRDVIGSGIHQEVASQVYWLNKRLDWLDHDHRTIHIHYEELCQNPNEVMKGIVEFCNAREFDLSCLQPMPEHFKCRISQPSDSKDAAKLWCELESLVDRHGHLSAGSNFTA